VVVINKTDRDDITEILLKVALNTITKHNSSVHIYIIFYMFQFCCHVIVFFMVNTHCIIFINKAAKKVHTFAESD